MRGVATGGAVAERVGAFTLGVVTHAFDHGAGCVTHRLDAALMIGVQVLGFQHRAAGVGFDHGVGRSASAEGVAVGSAKPDACQ